MDIKAYVESLASRARQVAVVGSQASSQQKNEALHAIAALISESTDLILEANALDCARAVERGLESPLIERMTLNVDRVQSMCEGLVQVAELSDPVGQMVDQNQRPNGLLISRMRTPIGVIGMIYESRPNVTVDAAALCMKAGNAAILRGGSECIETNQALATQIARGLEAAALPIQLVQLIETTDRAAVGQLLQQTAYVDLIIPRGGKSLIERSAAESRIPVLKHLDGGFHAWQFDMKGNCAHISRATEGYQDRLECKDVGLRRLRCEVKYGGFVWVTLNDGIGQTVEEWAGGAFDCMQKSLDAEPLEVFHYHKAIIPCNYKLWHDTNSEFYHDYLHYHNRVTGFNDSYFAQPSSRRRKEGRQP
jgi:hypothetical protein